jgi:Mrp family chromosome partitioning ATPase
MNTHDGERESRGVPATVRDLSRGDDTGLPGLQIKDLTRTEQLLNLEQQVSLFRQRNISRVFLFTSSRGEEGVSTVIINLVRLMVEKGDAQNVLVIDANGRRPVLHRFFQVPASPGLSEASLGMADPAQSIYPSPLKVDSGRKRGGHPTGRIHVMPYGSLEDGNGVMASQALPEVLSKVEGQYDCVFIDAPPVLSSADALALARSANVTFLVIEAYKTSWEAAKKTKTALESQGCFIGGVVLNRTQQVIPDWIYRRL